MKVAGLSIPRHPRPPDRIREVKLLRRETTKNIEYGQTTRTLTIRKEMPAGVSDGDRLRWPSAHSIALCEVSVVGFVDMAEFDAGDGSPAQFWKQVWYRVEPHIEAFVVDSVRYCLLAIALIFSAVLFKLLRYLGIPGWLLDILEPCDYIAIAITFGAFLVVLSRQALVGIFDSSK